MQHTQQREVPERISWARALIFAVGFFFIAAILIGQIPGYVFTEMTAASLDGLERGLLGLGVVMLAGFTIIQVIVLLFDPKPLIPPIIFTLLGAVSAIAGFALTVWSSLFGNQYFPSVNTSILPLLGGKFLWFQPNVIDFVMLGLAILTVGLAMIFYSILAIREQSNPDRRDPGTTPGIRLLIIASSILLVIFLVVYTYVNNEGLAIAWFGAKGAEAGLRYINFGASIFLGLAILLASAAFLLRLHYLMRPVRKRTMAPLYAVGALGLAQSAAILILAWIVIYPLIAWMHTWSFIGLNSYLTVCSKSELIPASCTFSQQAGYIIDTAVTSASFGLLMGAIWAWKSHRNLVIVGSFVTVGVVAFATLLLHTAPDQLLVAFLLCGAMLVLVTIWTSVARREFAVIGENNLGCLGQWLIFGTCLFIYLGAFAYFSIPEWAPENEPNIPFVSGLLVPPPTPAGSVPLVGTADAIVMLVLMAILGGLQFYFLTRNRYKV
ncbi:MAG: hypothetical protein J2P37_05875 [Ktedonobacteraceae bacterium]|nr:hypothetical protein [Ktedonobacteraceae bacterium]